VDVSKLSARQPKQGHKKRGGPEHHQDGAHPSSDAHFGGSKNKAADAAQSHVNGIQVQSQGAGGEAASVEPPKIRNKPGKGIEGNEADVQRTTEKSRPGPEHRIDLLGGFSYNYSTKTLAWHSARLPGRGPVEKSWRLNADVLTRSLGVESTIPLASTDIITVGLWAAVRATLWLSSQDSRPLLEFVGELDHHVYVL